MRLVIGGMARSSHAGCCWQTLPVRPGPQTVIGGRADQLPVAACSDGPAANSAVWASWRSGLVNQATRRSSSLQGGVQRTYLACGTASSTARSTCRQVWSTAANGWSGSVATSTSSSGDRPTSARGTPRTRTLAHRRPGGRRGDYRVDAVHQPAGQIAGDLPADVHENAVTANPATDRKSTR